MLFLIYCKELFVRILISFFGALCVYICLDEFIEDILSFIIELYLYITEDDDYDFLLNLGILEIAAIEDFVLNSISLFILVILLGIQGYLFLLPILTKKMFYILYTVFYISCILAIIIVCNFCLYSYLFSASLVNNIEEKEYLYFILEYNFLDFYKILKENFLITLCLVLLTCTLLYKKIQNIELYKFYSGLRVYYLIILTVLAQIYEISFLIFIGCLLLYIIICELYIFFLCLIDKQKIIDF